jgi:hemolysin III
MAFNPVDHRPYSRAERRADAAVHITGLAIALMAVPILITLAAVLRGDAAAIVSTSIYGVTLLTMLGASALYHMGHRHRWRGIYLRLDYSAIYLKIAGTYTPFIFLSGSHAWPLLIGLWGAALTGTGLKVAAPGGFRWVSLALYLGMGWAGVFVGRSMFETLSTPVIVLMIFGGVIYTVGVGFHIAHNLRFHISIWHGFVLVASGFFFAAINLHLIQTA